MAAKSAYFCVWEDFVPALRQKQHIPILHKIEQLRIAGKNIFPDQPLIFNALNYCYPQDVSVIILGQDPYHQLGQAHGLCFSANNSATTPRSLRNIFKEIATDIYGKTNDFLLPHNNLEYLAQQGVLLLNVILTVEESKPLSHANIGWQVITHSILQSLAHSENPLSVLLWGNFAKNYAHIFDNTKHLILSAAHPSPLSARRGFFGCRHFSTTNNWLVAHKKEPITWLNPTMP